MIQPLPIVLLLLVSTIICPFVLLWYNRSVPPFLIPAVREILHYGYYPFQWVGRLLGQGKDRMIQHYIKLNNRLIYQCKYGFSGNEILVLAPHCIQRSLCPHRITYQVENCVGCGLCTVEQLLGAQKNQQIQLKVVTGGTLARKMIQELRPKAIVAIACERDLSSGILDIKKIPVLAILNERPYGPCVDTWVDVEQVNQAILHFMKE